MSRPTKMAGSVVLHMVVDHSVQLDSQCVKKRLVEEDMIIVAVMVSVRLEEAHAFARCCNVPTMRW